jgi:two-component system, NtrC family, response regulator AtoC
VVARALALNPAGVILPEDLPEQVRGARAPVGAPPGLGLALGDRPTLDELGRRYAQLALAEAGGNKTRAAEQLGIDRKTLYRLLGEKD